MPTVNGQYVLPAIYEAVPGEKIRADQHNVPLRDLEQAQTDRVMRDGSAPMTGNLPMGGKRITGLAPATAGTDAPRYDQVLKATGFLDSVSKLALVADDLVYATNANTAAKTTLTPFARTLLDDTDAATMRATLGLGALATKNTAAIGTDTTGTLPLNRGGTGATTAAAARTAIGLGLLATKDTASISTNTTGTLPLNRGGTGATTAPDARSGIGISAIQAVINLLNAAVAHNSAAWSAGVATAGGLPSPKQIADAIKAQVVPGLGVGQTWVDVKASRAVGTSYQNTTGRAIMVFITSAAFERSPKVSSNGVTWVSLSSTSNYAKGDTSFIVPPGHYYKYDSVSGSFSTWLELR